MDENVKLLSLPPHSIFSNEEVESFARACVKNSLAPLEAELERWKSEVLATIQMIPGAVRVCEGGGPMDPLASLVVSVAKIVDEVTKRR